MVHHRNICALKTNICVLFPFCIQKSKLNGLNKCGAKNPFCVALSSAVCPVFKVLWSQTIHFFFHCMKNAHIGDGQIVDSMSMLTLSKLVQWTFHIYFNTQTNKAHKNKLLSKWFSRFWASVGFDAAGAQSGYFCRMLEFDSPTLHICLWFHFISSFSFSLRHNFHVQWTWTFFWGVVRFSNNKIFKY